MKLKQKDDTMLRCKRCGSSNLEYQSQTFKNGEKHIASVCTECKTFNGYVPKTKENIERVSGLYTGKKQIMLDKALLYVQTLQHEAGNPNNNAHFEEIKSLLKKIFS